MQQWLDYLRENHPDYRNVDISRENIRALPEDGSVHNELPVHEIEEGVNEDANGLPNDDPNRNPNGPNEDPASDSVPHESAVPNLLEGQTEMQRLQEAVYTAPLSMPSFRMTPMSEWDHNCIFRQAFPTLFPQGRGDFFLPRDNEISMLDWIRHLLRYKDERFARHSRFRYVAFNILMRSQAKRQAKWVCKKVNGVE